MAQIPSRDRLVNQQVAQMVQTCYFSKALPSTATAYWWQDIWNGSTTSIPVQGTFGTTGKANGRLLTRASTGALVYPGNAANGSTLHLLAASLSPQTSSSSATDIVLYDRICDVTLAYNEASGAITGMDATSRLPVGGGAQLMVTVASTLQATSNVVRFGYTANDGTSGRVTADITCSNTGLAVGKSVNGQKFQTLQNGDLGIRTLDSFTFVSGTGTTGTINVALVREIGYLPGQVLGHCQPRDFFFNSPSQPRIYDDSCVSMVLLPTSAAASRITGFIYLIEN